MSSSWFFLSTLNYDARSTTHQIVHSLKEIGDFLGGRWDTFSFVVWQYPDVVDGHVGIRQDGNRRHMKAHQGGTLVNGDGKLCACCIHFPCNLSSETRQLALKALRVTHNWSHIAGWRRVVAWVDGSLSNSAINCHNCKSDVWLTVHRNSVWIRKTN